MTDKKINFAAVYFQS